MKNINYKLRQFICYDVDDTENQMQPCHAWLLKITILINTLDN